MGSCWAFFAQGETGARLSQAQDGQARAGNALEKQNTQPVEPSATAPIGSPQPILKAPPPKLPRVTSAAFEHQVQQQRHEEEKENFKKEIQNAYNVVDDDDKKPAFSLFGMLFKKKKKEVWKDPAYRKQFAANVNNLGIDNDNTLKIPKRHRKNKGRSTRSVASFFTFTTKTRRSDQLSQRQSNYSLLSPEEQEKIEHNRGAGNNLLTKTPTI